MWYNMVNESSENGKYIFVRCKMNNCIDRNYNSVSRREARVYNEAFGEKVISFFCLVIAFFENSIVESVCRLLCGVLVAVGVFFYVSGVMSGALSLVGIVAYGAILIASSALVFKTKTVKCE